MTETPDKPVEDKISNGRIFGEAVTALGAVEAEVMDAVWAMGRPAHSMEVAEASLYKRRGKGQEPIGFSTINTTLMRLAEKGILTSAKNTTVKGRGSRTPYYTPTVGREEMAARILDHVSRTMLNRPFLPLDSSLLAFLPPEGEEIAAPAEASKAVGMGQGDKSR